MNRNEMEAVNEELNFTGYARNKVKSIGNQIADLTGKVELASGMAEEGLLEIGVYKNYALRQKKEIKDILAEIYTYLSLDDVKGRYDNVFKQKV